MQINKTTRTAVFLVLGIGTTLLIYLGATSAAFQERLSVDKNTASQSQQKIAIDKSLNNKEESPLPKSLSVSITNTTDENEESNLVFSDIQQLFANIDSKQQHALLTDETAFKKLVLQQENHYSLLKAAKANKIDTDPNAKYLMQRSAENTLQKIYLDLLIAEKMPSGFPSQQQIKEYYDKNKEQFNVAERLHVWQIFFPYTEDMDQQAMQKLEQTAQSIHTDIAQGKLAFSKAAAEQSGHESSRLNGGYAGLINIAELRPEINEPLLALEEGKISGLVKDKTGIHILKRGSIIPSQVISLAQSEAKIRKLMVSQARSQIFESVVAKARQTYPNDISDTQIEEWRNELKANL